MIPHRPNEDGSANGTNDYYMIQWYSDDFYVDVTTQP
jgi:hypothetical protein